MHSSSHAGACSHRPHYLGAVAAVVDCRRERLGHSGAVTFLQDVETQLRLLIAAPLLILAEVRAHRVLPQIVGLFVNAA